MRVAMAARAGVFLAVSVHAALQIVGLVGVAGLAVNRRDLVRMRIAFDVGVAIRALKAAVNAVAEFFPVDSDTVSRTVGHARVAVAGQAILRSKNARPNGE